MPGGTIPCPGPFFLLIAASLFPLQCECRCRGCDLAFASYNIAKGQNLTYISSLFGINSQQDIESRVLPPNNLTSDDSIPAEGSVRIPFGCGVIGGGLLGHTFKYRTQTEDTYTSIAQDRYRNLTTESSLRSVNSYDDWRIPDNVDINVTVSCFCGDADISRDYGLFSTYPIAPEDTLESVANATGFQFHDLDLLRRYNPTGNYAVGQIIYVPVKAAALWSSPAVASWSFTSVLASGGIVVLPTVASWSFTSLLASGGIVILHSGVSQTVLDKAP